jgi:VIT1/CCC1 family predicted Fe2+/Mn2+ transporter
MDDIGSALAGAVISKLQNNKYKSEGHFAKMSNSMELKKQIENAASIVIEIEKKYINRILAIDPSEKEINNVLNNYELLEKQKLQENIDNQKIEEKIKKILLIAGYSILSVFILWFLYGIVLDILGVKEANVSVTLILMLIGCYAGYLIKNKRHPILKK